MEINGTITGTKLTRDTIKELATELGRDFISLSLQEARGLAVDLGRYTTPFGLLENDGDGLKNRISAEIKQLFPSLDDGAPGAVRIFGLLEKHSKKHAQSFWNAYKSQDREAMEQVLTKRVTGLPRRLDRTGHKAARKAKHGRVVKGAKALAIVNRKARDSYIRRTQKKAGMAKAGWLHSAKALGGRVRRGGGRNSGTKETFPSWVRKAGARRKLGGASIIHGSSTIRITLRNTVRHIALPHSLIAVAERKAEKRFIRSLRHAKKYQVRRAQRRLKSRA